MIPLVLKIYDRKVRLFPKSAKAPSGLERYRLPSAPGLSYSTLFERVSAFLDRYPAPGSSRPSIH